MELVLGVKHSDSVIYPIAGLVDGYLGCFYFVAAMNTATVFVYKFLCGHICTPFSWAVSRSGTAGSHGNFELYFYFIFYFLTLSFRGTARLFSTVAADLGWERNGWGRSGE